LVNVEEKAMVIEIHQPKKLLLFNDAKQLLIHPEGQPPSWNGYTLESALLFSSGQLYAIQQDYSVRNVVYTVLHENRKHPWQKVIEFVEWGLATSNWLMPVEGDAAKAFQTPFICPDKVQELAFAQPMEPLKGLFHSCKKNTPEVWKMLLAELDQALKDRVK
jgi:hypothetical protein